MRNAFRHLIPNSLYIELFHMKQFLISHSSLTLFHVKQSKFYFIIDFAVILWYSINKL